MNILIISHKFYPDIGGIEINSELLADEFYNLGHSVRVVTWSEDLLSDSSFPYTIMRNPTMYGLLQSLYWADSVLENNPCLRLSWPLFFLRKKHVIALCTWVRRIDNHESWIDRFKLWWIKRADKVIAISDAVRKQACPDAIVIGNPYRDQMFHDCLISRDKDFVFVGRLVSDKGADLAIKLITELGKEDHSLSSYCLTIVGDGPEKANLISLVAELGLEDAVQFAGTLRGEELVTCINRHKYFLVPSRWEEPFGNVALEGMACGCIPIVSDGGGLPDAAGTAGIVFKRNSLDDFVEKTRDLLNSSRMQMYLKEQALEHLSRHKAEFVAKRYLEVLLQ